ncbi:MAG: hypothetical protein HEQ35_11700 [Gloeotrichia echinulata IR180]
MGTCTELVVGVASVYDAEGYVEKYWGLGIGLIYSLLITPYSLLLTIGDWGLD